MPFFPSINVALKGKCSKIPTELAKTVSVKVFALGRKISTMFSALKHKMAVFLHLNFLWFLFCFTKNEVAKILDAKKTHFHIISLLRIFCT